MKKSKDAIRVGQLIYLARLLAAGVQMFVIFYLYRKDVTTLGEYSYYQAIFAVLFQLVQFEGHFFSISGHLKIDLLRTYYKTTNIIWSGSIVVLLFMLVDSPIACTFVLIFVLSMSYEWVENFASVSERVKKNDVEFKKKYLVKIVCFEIISPVVIILFLPFLTKDQISFLPYILIFANLIVLFFGIGFILNVSILKIPPISMIYGAAIKRIDSMFIRIFVGSFGGISLLGSIQPILSLGRVLTVLTPTWLNVNYSSHISTTREKRNTLIKILMRLAFSYIIYVVLGASAFFGLKYFNHEFDLVLILLVFIYFGNQNTKAYLRVIAISINKHVDINKLSTFGLLIKLGMCLALTHVRIEGVVISVVVADLIIIAIGFASMYQKKR